MNERLVFSDGTKRGNRTKTIVRRMRGDVIVAETSQYFDADHQFVAAAKSLGLDRQTVQLAVRNQPADYIIGEARVEQFRVRPLTSSVVTSFNTIREAIEHSLTVADSTIEWDATSGVCALDADFEPDLTDARAFCMTVEPAPLAWWISRSGGLRLIYAAEQGWPADELAAAGSVALLRRFPLAKIELLHRTRRPPGSELNWRVPTTDVAAIKSMGGTTSLTDEDVQAWLISRGFEPGQRYPHDRCPVNPDASRAAGNAGPVLIFEDHVFCHICAADGICHGSKTPGYFPYAKLCGTVEQSLVRICASGFSHWGHARHVMGRILDNEQVARLAYSAVLRSSHGPHDPRLKTAFTAGEPTGLVRFDGYWATKTGQPVTLDRSSPILAALPAAQFLDGEEIKPSRERMEWLAQTIDIAALGYPPLMPVWGFQLTRHQELPPNRIYTVLDRVKLPADRKPKYVPSGRRMPILDAWKLLETAYPLVNQRAVTLLLAAKGCSEARSGLPPMVFLTGPTGSGKTATVHLAAAIAGDKVSSVQFTPSTERLRAAILDAKSECSFAYFDEYLKLARSSKTGATEAMEVLLGFTPESRSHMLYVGSVPLGELPAFIWADTTLPAEILGHSQIGRRVHHVHMEESLAWEESLRASGVGRPDGIRQAGSAAMIAAANAILSYVVDEYFPPGPLTDFAVVAEQLGFKRLRDSDHASEQIESIKKFFELTCAAPALVPPESQRWPGLGYKLIDITRDGPLQDAWMLLCDAKDQMNSRALEETDLKRALALKYPARFDRRTHGTKMVVRFISLDGQRVNEELLR